MRESGFCCPQRLVLCEILPQSLTNDIVLGRMNIFVIRRLNNEVAVFAIAQVERMRPRCEVKRRRSGGRKEFLMIVQAPDLLARRVLGVGRDGNSVTPGGITYEEGISIRGTVTSIVSPG